MRYGVTKGFELSGNALYRGDAKVQKFYESCGMTKGMKTAFIKRW